MTFFLINQYITNFKEVYCLQIMGQFREKLHWDGAEGQILDADRRYLMMRTDVLMGLFRRLDEPTRQQALQALGQAVREQGGQSAQAYWEAIGHNPQALLDSIASISAQLGWGVWQIAHQPSGGLHVQVHNSPFAHGFGPCSLPVCHPIVGMLTAVGTLIHPQGVEVQEQRCCAQGAQADCQFTVTPLAPIAHAQEKTSSPQAEYAPAGVPTPAQPHAQWQHYL